MCKNVPEQAACSVHACLQSKIIYIYIHFYPLFYQDPHVPIGKLVSYMSLFYTFVTEQNCKNSCHLAAYLHSSLAEIMKGIPFRADTL